MGVDQDLLFKQAALSGFGEVVGTGHSLLEFL